MTDSMCKGLNGTIHNRSSTGCQCLLKQRNTEKELKLWASHSLHNFEIGGRPVPKRCEKQLIIHQTDLICAYFHVLLTE